MKKFFRAALIRAAHTMVQTGIAGISTSAVILSDVNWRHMASAMMLAGILSIFKSILVGLPEIEEEMHESD